MRKKSSIRFLLRIPPELHEKLINAANNRNPPNSLNSEILRRLYESVQIETDDLATALKGKSAPELFAFLQMYQGAKFRDTIEKVRALGLEEKKKTEKE